jgi:hypothetical protein
MNSARHIQQVVQDLLNHAAPGEITSVEDVRRLTGAHPDLPPDLEEELRKLRPIFEAGARAGLSAVRAGPAPGACSPGQIGKYQVVALLGQGGQALTYQAFDPDTQRHVVLKLYHAAGTADEQEQILKEARTWARVRSPYVARCYGVERHDGVPYLVAEYIPGRSLAELSRTQPLDLAQALEVTARVAEGLAAVHRCGLLHRDLKPANILIADGGTPYLVDFGFAAYQGDASLRRAAGTAAFMAPEQARGEVERIDPRTDLFGLGAVLYFLLTGTPPCSATDPGAGQPVVPARVRNPRVPAAVSALCQRCLAADPADRFASAAEFGLAIRRWQRRRRWRRALPWAVAAAALLVSAVSAAWWATAPRDLNVKKNAEEAGVPQPDGRPLRQDFPFTFVVEGTHQGPTPGVHYIRQPEKEGEKGLSFRIEVPLDCYVLVYDTDDQGKVTQLFPNAFDTTPLVRAGEPRLLPGKYRYWFPLTASPGPDVVHVIASTEPWAPPRGQQFRGFEVFDSAEARDDVTAALRGIGVAPRAGNRMVSEKRLWIQVLPR